MSEAVLEKPVAADATESLKMTARLVRPREEAIAFVQTQIKKGAEIKALRIRNGQELDHAQAQKLDWTNQTADLLKELFDSTVVADECNDWVGKIYPEYAEFGNFVEQFYAEMDHRLKKLKIVIRQIQRLPSETRASAPEALISPVPVAAAPAPVAVPSVMVAPKLRPEPEVVKGVIILFNADENAKNALSEFLDSLDVESTVIDETGTNPSRLVEELDRARDAAFGVILVADGQPERAFELGFCVGRLGVRRICVVHAQQSQASGNDPRGIAHVNLDSAGGWQLVLARHLKRAGLGVDLNRLC